MQKSLTKKLILNTFWLSVFIHLLLLFSVSITVIFQPEEQRKKAPHLYVPSYVYTGKTAPIFQPRTLAHKQSSAQKRNSIEPARQSIAVAPKQENVPKKSLLTASLDALKEETRQQVMKANKNSEPIYLVGEENAVSDPLIKLLGKALSANFDYPKMAGEFGIEGRVLLRLTLHPEGYLSDIQMLESSNNRDLDAAALYAANSAPTIIGVDRFLAEPRRFVIGFIFKIQPDNIVRFRANKQ